MKHAHAVAWTLALVVATALEARAVDQLLPGRNLMVRDANGNERLVMVLRSTAIVAPPYQLDLVRPGMTPFEPSSRSATRDILSFR